MEDEELEKKAGTQTATDTTGAKANENEEQNNEANRNNTQNKNVSEQNKDLEDKKQDDKIANAFGNKSVNKIEGEKGKKTKSVAKTNPDGSITFGSQEELNGFINRLHAEKKEEKEKVINTKSTDVQDDKALEDENKVDEKQENLAVTVDFTADIALALVESDIDPKKARRAANLVDKDKVIINNQLDTAKLQEEINAIIAEFPELKATKQEIDNNGNGVRFGAGQQEKTDTGSDTISEIFGNKK